MWSHLGLRSGGGEGGQIQKHIPMEHGLSSVTCPRLLLQVPQVTQLPKPKTWVPSPPWPVGSSSAMSVDPPWPLAPCSLCRLWTARLPQTHRGPCLEPSCHLSLQSSPHIIPNLLAAGHVSPLHGAFQGGRRATYLFSRLWWSGVQPRSQAPWRRLQISPIPAW